MAINVARRKFITGLSGATVMWPLAAHAQQPKRVRRIGVLMPTADDPDGRVRLGAFVQGLQEAGWADGRNVEIDTRWAASDRDLFRKYASELVALEPDVILARTSPAVREVQQASRTVPIVFVDLSDPIGLGFVESFSRPGGNITGFTNFEATLGGKWLELLKEIAPSIKRVSMLFNPETANAGASGGIYLPSIEAAARALNIELTVSPVHKPADIDDVFAALAQSPDGGLMVMPNAFFTSANGKRIVAQAEQYQIPTVYPGVPYVNAGGLLCYSVDTIDMFRRAADYVDRILKGEKPANLPVQAPTKFKLVINLKTAKALGLAVPDHLLTLADEAVE